MADVKQMREENLKKSREYVESFLPFFEGELVSEIEVMTKAPEDRFKYMMGYLASRGGTGISFTMAHRMPGYDGPIPAKDEVLTGMCNTLAEIIYRPENFKPILELESL